MARANRGDPSLSLVESPKNGLHKHHYGRQRMELADQQRPKPVHVYRDALYLSQCPMEGARAWLAKGSTGEPSPGDTPETPAESHLLEYILYRRNEPLLDLALAECGSSRTVLERVFARGTHSTRVVACRNPALFVGDKAATCPVLGDELTPLFTRIVTSGSLAELRALCEIPNLPHEYYEYLITAWQGDLDSRLPRPRRITDERFRKVLGFLANNPRIATSREDTPDRYFWDGYDEHLYDQFFVKAWQLAWKVPAEQQWASPLSVLYERLHAPFNVIEDIDAVLKHWRLPGERMGSPSVSVREAIATRFLTPSVDMLESDDQALRQAFYATFDPERPELRKLDWTTWLDRDWWCPIWLERNERVWFSPSGREKLHALLWAAVERQDSLDVTDIGRFHELEEAYRASHPEWFTDEDTGENRATSHDTGSQVENVSELKRMVEEHFYALRQSRTADALLLLCAGVAAALLGSYLGAELW